MCRPNIKNFKVFLPPLARACTLHIKGEPSCKFKHRWNRFHFYLIHVVTTKHDHCNALPCCQNTARVKGGQQVAIQNWASLVYIFKADCLILNYYEGFLLYSNSLTFPNTLRLLSFVVHHVIYCKWIRNFDSTNILKRQLEHYRTVWKCDIKMTSSACASWIPFH